MLVEVSQISIRKIRLVSNLEKADPTREKQPATVLLGHISQFGWRRPAVGAGSKGSKLVLYDQLVSIEYISYCSEIPMASSNASTQNIP